MNKELNEAAEKLWNKWAMEHDGFVYMTKSLFTIAMQSPIMKEYWYAQWQAEQKEVSASLGFAKWLEENTEAIREGKITLYRYCDKNNECGNYTLNDIYAEWLDESVLQKQVPTDEEIDALAKENFPNYDYGRKIFVKGFKSALQYSASGQIKDLLHTILNFQQEVYIDALRSEMVRVADIKTCFDEYFGIKEEPEF